MLTADWLRVVTVADVKTVYSVLRQHRCRLEGQAAARSFGILQSPSNCAPSLSTRLAVVIVHLSRAVGSSSRRSRATISPLTRPATVTREPVIRAVTTAPSAITISSPVISPSASPSIFADARKTSLPEIFAPLPIRDSNSRSSFNAISQTPLLETTLRNMTGNRRRGNQRLRLTRTIAAADKSIRIRYASDGSDAPWNCTSCVGRNRTSGDGVRMPPAGAAATGHQLEHSSDRIRGLRLLGRRGADGTARGCHRRMHLD